MTVGKFLLLAAFITILNSCRVESKHLAGRYVNVAFGDTLQIYADRKYEYLERLNTGNLGWTHGQWKITNNKIEFTSSRKALVGYKLKIHRDTSKHIFEIKFLLADTETPLYIEDVKLMKNDKVLSNDSYSTSKNELRIFASDFDSILIYTSNFTAIPIPNTLNKSHAYTARIYPEERLYELDKIPFKIRRTTLISVPVKTGDDISYIFRKLH